MGRRTLLLLAALLVAALGTAGILLYVIGVDDRAKQQYTLVEVLVATSTIEAGTSAVDADARGLLDLREFLASSVADIGAQSNITLIAEQVALAAIPAGAPILASQFGAPNQSQSLAVPEGKLAVSVSLSDTGRVAGFVRPGSKVAIFLRSTPTQGPDAGRLSVRVLLPNVEVLAAGDRTIVPATDAEAVPAEPLPLTLLTLAVDQEQAQKIIYAQEQGAAALTFALLDAYPVDPGLGPTTADNLFD